MSGTFPSSPAPRSVSVRSIQPARVSTAHSLKRYTRTSNAQRWAFSLDFSHLTREKWAPLWGFILKQRGEFDTFTWVLPTPLKTPQGAGAGASTCVNGNFGSPAEQQTGRAIYTRSWTPSVTVLKAGGFIKFTSHSKVYGVPDDVTSDSSGLALVPVEPAVVQAVDDGDILITNNIPFTVSLARAENGFEFGIASVFDLQRVELIEAL